MKPNPYTPEGRAQRRAEAKGFRAGQSTLIEGYKETERQMGEALTALNEEVAELEAKVQRLTLERDAYKAALQEFADLEGEGVVWGGIVASHAQRALDRIKQLREGQIDGRPKT